MKFSTFAITISITLNGVNAFSQLKLNNRAALSSSRTFASVTEDISTSEADLDYTRVKQLTFRQLQKQCKERGLPATGNTAALRTRLYGALGIMECSVDSTTEENVSSIYVDCVFPSFFCYIVFFYECPCSLFFTDEQSFFVYILKTQL